MDMDNWNKYRYITLLLLDFRIIMNQLKRVHLLHDIVVNLLSMRSLLCIIHTIRIRNNDQLFLIYNMACSQQKYEKTKKCCSAPPIGRSSNYVLIL